MLKWWLYKMPISHYFSQNFGLTNQIWVCQASFASFGVMKDIVTWQVAYGGVGSPEKE